MSDKAGSTVEFTGDRLKSEKGRERGEKGRKKMEKRREGQTGTWERW